MGYTVFKYYKCFFEVKRSRLNSQVFNLTDCNLTNHLNHIWCHRFCFITALIELELPFCLVYNIPFLNVASLDRF